MIIQNIGATTRRKLSLPFTSRDGSPTALARSASPLLSGHELRRLVAEMTD